MRFTRKPFMTALMVLALLIVGMGRRDVAQAKVWGIGDPQGQNSQGGPTPNSGEPDVGSTRVQRNVILISTPRSAPTADRGIKARGVPAVRWLGWFWVNRFLGMGL